jgi:alkanesulfonate monooxygenase SsuD/methylene tetrahydromethanopterin reductase-like flavin-dependent oxidoreductase (luciferase family)
MIVKVGVFTVVDTYHASHHPNGHNRHSSVIELGVRAEQVGLDSFWVGEHHFHPSGACPSPPVLLAAIGARTVRIRLGSLVCVLPFHRPIEVAEQYALLDQITQGRLNFGVGSGYVPLELEGFGVPGAEKRQRFDRALSEVLAAFSGEEVPGEGSMPVRLNVLPRQRPYPPVWVAVQRKLALAACAQKGLSVALLAYASFADRADLARSISEYRANLPPGQTRSVAVVVPAYVGPDRTRAVRAFRHHLRSRPALSSGYYQDSVHLPAQKIHSDRAINPELTMFGDRATVADQMQDFRRMGVDQLLGMVDFGGLSQQDAERSLAGLAGFE